MRARFFSAQGPVAQPAPIQFLGNVPQANVLKAQAASLFSDEVKQSYSGSKKRQDQDATESADIDSSHDGVYKTGKRLRRRHLNEQQQIVLEKEYQKNPRFDSDRVVILAKQLGLNRTKVYKWGWDRRKKE